MQNEKWLDLQLFAGEGAGGEGGGEGAATGETGAVDPGQQRLLELGVPADKIRNRAKKAVPKAEAVSQPKTEEQQPEQVAAAKEDPTEETKQDAPKRMTWEEIMADPEYNRQMQMTVQSRLKSAKGAEESLAKLTPAIEVLARRYNLDPVNPDMVALAKAIEDDNSFYEDKALAMGGSVEEAKRADIDERAAARQQRSLREQKIYDHYNGLRKQAEQMKKIFPNFDLETELKNPAFFRMTAPDSGLTVEQVYYAVHHKELQGAAMQMAAQKTADQISRAIQSGSKRPDEAGTSAQAPSVTTFDYRAKSKEERDAFKKHILSEMAQGRKVYPGQR